MQTCHPRVTRHFLHLRSDWTSRPPTSGRRGVESDDAPAHCFLLVLVIVLVLLFLIVLVLVIVLALSPARSIVKKRRVACAILSDRETAPASQRTTFQRPAPRRLPTTTQGTSQFHHPHLQNTAPR